MKSDFGRAVSVIAILFLVAFAGAAKAHAQDAVLPLTSQASLTAIPSMPGPAIGEQFTELSSGIFTYSKTDLSLPGPMPINVSRVYRSTDETSSTWNNRAFGIGTRLNYDMFVYSGILIKYVSMPDSSVLSCPGTAFGAPYTCNSQPSGVWFGSEIDANDNLTRPDGTVYSFNPTTGLLTSITDRYTNSITITRGNGSIKENSACYTGSLGLQYVPSTYVGEVLSSNNRAVYFCYDDPNNHTDITGIADNASGGPIKKVTYTYGSAGQLATVTQGNSSYAVTKYQYNQTSPSGQGNITTIIVNDSCPSGGCGSPNQVYTYITYYNNNLGTVVSSISSQLPGNGYNYNYNGPSGYPASHVTVTLPDSATRDFYFDSQGYVTNDDRNAGGSTPEYTVFSRGQQTVGTSAEFVGEVQEKNQSGNGNAVRQTTYNYDTTAGNVLGVTLCPAPGQTATTCGSGTATATWNYTYTTYNRLASAVEPLAYNGVGTTYTYVDPPSSPSMTVTDPLGRVTIVDYNGQGQPKSVEDPMTYSTTIEYYSNGYSNEDLESVTDPIGNTTKYTTDADGRVTSVISPKLETTKYFYDAIDDVTEVIDPMNNITCNSYDLIGELAATTPPRGVLGSCTNVNSAFTTTVTRTPNLAKTTVTDPLGYTTVTDLDGQGRKTDYTDKRGIETTYSFDKFGRVTQALFNSNNKSGYSQDTVAMSSFDALDRILTLSDSLSGSTLTYSYDSLDSVLLEKDSLTNDIASYGYDYNGRRTSLQPTMNSVSQPTISYGYDCADELIAMSNSTTVSSCSPSYFIANGSTSTQVGINYDADGNPNYIVVDGVQNVMATVTAPRDKDERVKVQTFQAYPSLYSYGGLTYAYDADGHLTDKGGTLAAINLPGAATATYSATDQVLTWSGVSSTVDDASNITYDPASGLALAWTARNQMAAASEGVLETYDGLGRRETSTGTGGGYTLDFEHDGATMIGWTSISLGAFYDFLDIPGGGAVAGSFTSGGSTTTWVPLIDAAGSTIALVNAASPQSTPATTYTYDPAGTPSPNGAANDWPFLYQGGEKEVSDPGPLYYSGGGQFYSPQLVRSLSETSQTSSQGNNGGPAGNGIAAPSGGGGPGLFSLSSDATGAEDAAAGAAAGFVAGAAYTAATAGLIILGAESGATIGASFGPVGALIGAALGAIAGFFEELFGGGGSAPPTPRQLLHARHPLYRKILAVSDSLIVTEASEGTKICYDGPQPCTDQPLQKDEPTPEYRKAAQPPTGLGAFFACGGGVHRLQPRVDGWVRHHGGRLRRS